MPGPPPTYVYLSPHLDDAVFACGGSLHRHAQTGARVIAVTVCAGDPPRGPLSPLAQELHQRWAGPEAAPADPTALAARRRAEDLAALAALGAEAVHLDLPDCIYRHAADNRLHLYPTNASLFGPPQPADLPLARRVAAKLTTLLRGLGRAHLYVPLGLGNHVDHALTRRAAELAGGIRAYYEDYPYVARLGAQWPNPDLTQAHGRPLHAELVPLNEADLAAKLAAIRCYASQISSFWSDTDGMHAAVREFAAHTGAGQPAERVWRLG